MSYVKSYYIALLFICFSVVGCGSNDTNDDFVIAAVIPKTGPIAYLGEQELAGLELAAEDINATGGILGRKVLVKWEDTGGDVAKAVTAANKLLFDGKVDMLFVTTTGAVKAVAPIAASNKVPMFAMSSDIGITELNDYIFRMYMNFGDEQKVIANYIKNKNLKNIVLLRPEDEAFLNSQKELVANLNSEGNSLLAYETFSKQDKNYRVQIEKLLGNKPDGLILLGYGPDYPALLDQIRENPNSVGVSIIGGYAMISRAAQQNGTSFFEDVPFVSFEAIKSSGLTDFTNRVGQKLNRPAGQFLDYISAYDALMFVGSISNSGDNKESLISLINRADKYEGVGGVYRFNKSRDASMPLAIAKYFGSDAQIVWQP